MAQPTSLPSNVTLIIAQLRTRYGHDLLYMYRPIVQTLQRRFCYGRVVHLVFPEENHAVAVVRNGSEIELALESAIAKNNQPCAFFWIGDGRLPLKHGRSVGSRCTRHRYETEAIVYTAAARKTATSIWSYTRRQTHAAYLPPQYVPSNFTLTHVNPLPTFLGHLDFRWGVPVFRACPVFRATARGRGVAWLRRRQLPRSRGTELLVDGELTVCQAIETLWSDEKLQRRLGDASIFVNWHKNCLAADQPLETFRIAALLSLGALVVSQRSHARDEAEFAGLVDFVDDAQFWPFVATLRNMSTAARQALGRERMERFRRQSTTCARSGMVT